MHRFRKHVAFAVIVVVAFALVVTMVACNGSDNSSNDKTPATEQPPSSDNGESSDSAGDGQRLVEVKCSMCHSLDRVWAAEKTREEWAVTVDRMKANGLVVTEDEYGVIIDHLVSSAGK
ncbi:MAG: hypothetical protein OEV43_09835 [Coriobacteriia bacterium]|nr:hypothetical protein [Coriobacteriia bacterium]